MIYVDSSSLLKLLWNEPESSSVIDAIAAENTVLVSALAELETVVQLKAGYLGGDYSLSQLRRLEGQLAVFRNHPPYEFRALPGTVFQTAIIQNQNSGRAHCRTLDRLHLAAMQELDVTRLMTNDGNQAKAAAEAGFEVIRPGRD